MTQRDEPAFGTWQSIETAPKDGTPFLAKGGQMTASAELTKQNIESNRYAAPHDFPCVVGVAKSNRYFDRDIGDFVDPKIFRYCNYQGGYYGYYEGATHWMPLPLESEAAQ